MIFNHMLVHNLGVFGTLERNEYKSHGVTKPQASPESTVLPPAGHVAHGMMTTSASSFPVYRTWYYWGAVLRQWKL